MTLEKDTDSIIRNRRIAEGFRIISQHYLDIANELRVISEEIFSHKDEDYLRNLRVEKNKYLDISELELSTRSYNGLIDANINTVEELSKFSVRELRKLPNLGVRSVREIEEIMNNIGIPLRRV